MPVQSHVDVGFKDQLDFRKVLRTIMLIVMVSAALGVGRAVAEPFSQFIVFGDGFSDNGNVFLASNRLVPASPPNFEGRLSNGRLWVEQLAERFALTLTPVQAGGTNYASIGAKVNDDVSLSQPQGAVTIPGIASQVDLFLATIPPDDPENDIDNEADPKALYVVFGGSNDLFDLVSQTDANGTSVECPVPAAEAFANDLLIAINKLGAEGAVYFLVPNLPPLARTPRGLALDTASQERLASCVTAFNNLLAVGLPRLETDLGIVAFRLDTASTFDRILSNPAAAGIANVSDACLAGDALSGGTPCPDPGAHLFWDAFRPTEAGHTAIANAALTGRVLMAETSIQAAVDMAQPGDIVIVPPGRYAGTVVVTQSDLTIQASRQAVLDASGVPAGLSVGGGEIAPDAQGIPQCPPVALSNFTLRGLTIRNAQQHGISLIGVDTFQVSGGEYLGNGQYGIHLSCSQNGVIGANRISGHTQSAVFLSNHNNGTVRDNRLTNNGMGIEIENSANITIIENSQISVNTAGIVISAQPDMPQPATQDIAIIDNLVSRNNRPLAAADRTGLLGAVPVGSGILNLGGDNVVMRENLVLRNDTLGIGILSNPFVASDPRVDPAPDNNQVIDNLSLQNAGMPDPGQAATPSADIVYDSSGAGNCFSDNLALTVVPDTLTSGFPCP